jgi:glycolate oxidase FAD binding subunit
MKNVAGYDVSRLVCGALGTLGLITRVSLKVLPRPVAELSLQFDMPATQALNALAEWGQLPLPLSASAVTHDRLRLRLSGARSAVDAAHRRLGGEVLLENAADDYWRQLREHTDPFFNGASLDLPLWRFSVPPTAPPLNLPGPQLIEWHGAQRWLRAEGNAVQLRAAATAVGGHATLFRGTAAGVDAFTVSMPALMQLQLQLKRSFDPHGVFNPGRLYRSF